MEKSPYKGNKEREEEAFSKEKTGALRESNRGDKKSCYLNFLFDSFWNVGKLKENQVNFSSSKELKERL